MYDCGQCDRCRSRWYTVPVDVVLPVGGQVVVDDERDLLHVNPAGQQIRGDQDSARPGPELTHDHIALLVIRKQFQLHCSPIFNLA